MTETGNIQIPLAIHSNLSNYKTLSTSFTVLFPSFLKGEKDLRALTEKEEKC